MNILVENDSKRPQNISLKIYDAPACNVVESTYRKERPEKNK